MTDEFDLIAKVAVEGNKSDQLSAAVDEIEQLKRNNISVDELSDLSDDLGEMRAGRFVAGNLQISEDGTLSESGVVMSAEAIPLNDIDGIPTAHILGVNNGQPQFWLDANDGSGGFAGGAGRLNKSGVELNGAGRYLTQTATIGDESRVGRIGMVDDESGTPTWLLDYFDPNDINNVELMTGLNGGFETGDLTNWTIVAGTATYSVQSDIVNSGNYALKINTFNKYLKIKNNEVFNLDEGGDYLLSGYARSDWLDSTGETWMRLIVEFYSDADCTTLLKKTYGEFYLTASFTKYSLPVTVPVGGSYAVIYVEGYSSYNNPVYIDDISFLNIPDENISKIALVDGGVSITGDLVANNYASSQWMMVNEKWIYSSSTEVVTSGNFTNKYRKGDKIKFVQSSTQKYFYVTNVYYSAGLDKTTITLCGGSDYTVANATISDVYYSRAADPMGFPAYFNYTVAWTATTNPSIGNGTLTGKFKMEGTLVWVQVFMTAAANTTFGSGGWIFSLPVSMETSFGVAYLLDNGTADRMGLVTAGTTATLISYAGGTISATFPWTWAANDRCWFTVTGNMA